MQFIGLPQTAYWLNRYVRLYVSGIRGAEPDPVLQRKIEDNIDREKREIGYLEPEIFKGRRFVGRWFSTIIPPDSKRIKRRQFPFSDKIPYTEPMGRRVFQGLREDVYQSLLRLDPIANVARDRVVNLRNGRA